MATLLSPGVGIQEQNFTTIIPSVASSVGGIVGRFSQGPINTPILISDEVPLVNVFGPPNDLNANEWHTTAEFLKYTNACWVVRSSNSGIYNAVSTGVSSVNILNRNDYENISSGTQTTAGQFIAKNAGSVGNGIGVIMVDSGSWAAFNTWCTANLSLFVNNQSLAAQFYAPPSTTQYMADLSADNTARNDEMHILVIDVTGTVTGTPYTILEVFQGTSKASDALNYQGLTIYYANVINEASKYIWWSEAPTQTSGANIIPFGSDSSLAAPVGKTFAAINITSTPFFLDQTLSGGVDGTPSTLANIMTAYDTLSNKDLYSVDLMMCGAFSVGTIGQVEQYVIENVVGKRTDCVAFCSPHTNGAPIKDSITAAATIAAFKVSVAVSDTQGSYGFMDTGMKYIYDRYSAKYRYVPLNGDMAGLAARTDASNDPWWSFAGYNRGGILNVIKFAYNPSQPDRDFLYPQGINPCIIDPSDGPILFGDRTMTTKPSAFDRVNVRRLFIVLEKAIGKASKYSFFEFNDNFTQVQFVNMVTPYLKSIKGRRGVTDFSVQCDSTNNTPQVVDSNQFVASIFVIPNRSINFIQLSFVATQSGVSFSTVVGVQAS